MRRGGFTMIELIFVIVILGILAAVALPKFVGVMEQAHEANLKAFVGTLNRTVAPTLWAKHVKDGGSVTNETDLSQYVDIPEGYSSISLKNCGKNQFKEIARTNSAKTGDIEYILECRDGNASTAPSFRLKRGDTGEIIAGPGAS